MAADAGPTILGGIGTLSPNGAKARFGVAYVRSVCSHASVGFDETSIDEDVLAVDGTVNFAVGPARVQIKCTGQFRINGGATATWPAEAGWWAKWHKSKVPVYLVVVMVDPDDQIGWLEHQDDATLSRSAAFWVRVDTLSEATSITVPRAQRFTAATLTAWSADVEASFGNLAGLGGARAS